MRKSKVTTVSGGETSTGEPRSSNSGEFYGEEKVLCYHGPRLFQAKIQKTELGENGMEYFVHYLGWNEIFDEWVGADRLLKYNEDNVIKQRKLERKQRLDRNLKPGMLVQTKPKGSLAARGRKRKPDSLMEKGSVATKKVLNIRIPLTLMRQLIDERDFITKQDKLINLPRCPSMDDILTKYLDYTSKDVMLGNSMQEILNGMQCYFNKALPAYLLYKQERLQYREAVSDNGSPSRIYGAEHLLRLFVKLPELLTFVNIKEDTLIALQKLVLNFLKFLQKNRDTLFVCGAYDDPTDSEGSSEGIDNCRDSVHFDQTHP